MDDGISTTPLLAWQKHPSALLLSATYPCTCYFPTVCSTHRLRSHNSILVLYTLLYSTLLYSTVPHSTAQYSTVPHSTVQSSPSFVLRPPPSRSFPRLGCTCSTLTVWKARCPTFVPCSRRRHHHQPCFTAFSRFPGLTCSTGLPLLPLPVERTPPRYTLLPALPHSGSIHTTLHSTAPSASETERVWPRHLSPCGISTKEKQRLSQP